MNRRLHYVFEEAPPFRWIGKISELEPIKETEDLSLIDRLGFLIKRNEQLMFAGSGEIFLNGSSDRRSELEVSYPCYGTLRPTSKVSVGDPGFCLEYGTSSAYMTGAMANGIASSELVIAAGKAGFLGTFGSGGLSLKKVEQSLQHVQQSLKTGPYAFNLLSNPREPDKEWSLVRLFLKYQVRTIEASAYIKLSLPLVYYRVSGFSYHSSGKPRALNKIIAKISRAEVALQFMKPAPTAYLDQLLSEGLITHQQAEIARTYPMAGDITVEADSGGHTDNRPLVSLLPSIMSLRDSVQSQYNYQPPLRVGAAGGISTPAAALAAFSMGAAYIVTGSINQASVEAGTSSRVKELLGQAQMADVAMAPAADMFELGAKVQVLKKGTMYPINAQKLYKFYSTYDAIENFSRKDKEFLELKIFKRSVEEVWRDTKSYFESISPKEIEKCQLNPKHKLLLILRWYLGMSSNWAIAGEQSKVVDYQIWCGQSMGAFNDWVKGTDLEDVSNRRVAEIGRSIMDGVTCMRQLQQLHELGCIATII